MLRPRERDAEARLRGAARCGARKRGAMTATRTRLALRFVVGLDRR